MKHLPSHKNRLRQQRILHNWRLRDVADQLDTTINTVQRWERGRQYPSAYYRSKLCTLFGLSAQELGFAEGGMAPALPAPQSTSQAIGVAEAGRQELGLWIVPWARNPHFTGRLDLLNRLLEIVSPSETSSGLPAAGLQVQILTGPVGIGKTQIAIEYAYRVREQEPATHLFWIDASDEETILASFAAIADLLPGLPPLCSSPHHQLVAAVLHWLGHCPHPWVLILDGVADLELIQQYLPVQGNGRLLLTTQASAVGWLGLPLIVDALSIEEATQLLLHRTQRFAPVSCEETNEARRLAETLKCYPLLLDQAGAYLEETGCGFSAYLQLYQQHRPLLLARRGAGAGPSSPALAAAWSLAVQKIQQINPAAAELLSLGAFLAPDHLPEELLTQGAAYWPPTLQQAVADLFTFNQLVQDLLAFSLVKRVGKDHLLWLHGLIQDLHRDLMTTAEQRQWAERVVRVVHALFPRDPEDAASWFLCQRYLVQAKACQRLIEQYQLVFPEAADLLDRIGTYLVRHAQHICTQVVYGQAGSICEPVLELPRRGTVSNQGHRATSHWLQGEYAQAESLYRQALAIREQVLGPQHLNTVQSLDHLATLYQLRGAYTQSELLYRQVLSIREQILGPEHVDTAHSLRCLAMLYRDREGKLEQALSLLVRALQIQEHALAPTDPELAETLHALALLQQQQGHHEEARISYERALTARTQTPGRVHLSTHAMRSEPVEELNFASAFVRGEKTVMSGDTTHHEKR